MLKGGHSINDANDLLCENGRLVWFDGKRSDNPNTYGTGCTLSSAIASNLAKEYSLEESVKKAKDYISDALAAGLGSAPIAHAASSTISPVQQGLWGMFEVFFTTIVICTLSALLILSTGIWDTGTAQGAALSIASYNAIFPKVGGVIVTLSTIFFALSTILGWAYYGEVCI